MKQRKEDDDGEQKEEEDDEIMQLTAKVETKTIELYRSLVRFIALAR